MSNFPKAKVGDLLTLQRGFDITKKEQTDGFYPVVSSSGITSYHDKFKATGPGVVIGRKGTLGSAFYIETDYWPHDTTLWVKDFKDSDPKFIYYFLKTLRLERLDSGSSNPTLNRNFVHALDTNKPEPNTQKKIAAVLSALDAKIDCNNRINAELEAMAKTLYDYWFVQFDFPYDFAQGKPDQNGKPYKSSGGKMTYNPTLKRDIPAGWKVGQLNQLVSLERGVTYGKKDVCTSDTGETVGVLRATNVTGNVIDVDDLVYVPDSKVSSAQIITKFETLIVMSSGSKEHVGKNGTYYFDNPLGFGAFCSKITASVNSRYFVQTFLQSNWFKAYIKNQCLGTNINNLTNNHINECPILKPDEKTQSIFEATVKSCYEKVACNTLENHSLQQLRDWLLPMLMNGQVTVK